MEDSSRGAREGSSDGGATYGRDSTGGIRDEGPWGGVVGAAGPLTGGAFVMVYGVAFEYF